MRLNWPAMVGDIVAKSTIVMSTPTIDEPAAGHAVAVEPREHGREHPVVGRGLGGLAHQQHPPAERPHRLEDGAHG